MNVEELKKFIAEALEEEEPKKVELEIEVSDDKIEVEGKIDDTEFAIEGDPKEEQPEETETPAEETEEEPADEQMEESINEEEKAFFVTFKVEGRYTVKVDAKNINEAILKGHEAIDNIYFGDLDDEDDEALYIEDEKGNRVWEDLD